MSLIRKSLRKDTKATSTAVARAASAARLRTTIVCQGIGEGELITIGKDKFNLLDVDQRYQRDRIGMRVNDLIEAISKGGMIPDPVTLVKRTFREPGIDQNKLWVIDGQQRVMAFLELNMPFKAMLHTANSIENEANFFLAMNNRTIVNSNVIVHTWPGHAGKVIRSAAQDVDHPLYGKIDFKGRKGAFRAAVLAAAVANACGVGDKGSIQDILSRIDGGVERDSHNVGRSKAVLHLIAAVFPQGYPSAIAMRALGDAACQKWLNGGQPLPCKKCLYNITRINWSVLAPTNNDRFRCLIEMEISKRWKC